MQVATIAFFSKCRLQTAHVDPVTPPPQSTQWGTLNTTSREAQTSDNDYSLAMIKKNHKICSMDFNIHDLYLSRLVKYQM